MSGVLILLLLALALFVLGVRVPDLPADGLLAEILEKAAAALIGGLLIGLLEETFFWWGAVRRRALPQRVAVGRFFRSATLYALLHFMKPHGLPDGVAFDWSGVGIMFIQVFTDVAQWRHLDSMLALFLVGVFLALVRERTGPHRLVHRPARGLGVRHPGLAPP